MPISRCVTRHCLWGCKNSIGSSTVTMWPRVFWLIQSTMAANVVDLPAPVAPTKITKPRFCSAIVFKACGKPSSSKLGGLLAIARNTMPTCPSCMNALTRKRGRAGGASAKLLSLVCWKWLNWSGVMMARAMASVLSPLIGRSDKRTSWPLTLMAGGASALTNKSLPWRATKSPKCACSQACTCGFSAVVLIR